MSEVIVIESGKYTVVNELDEGGGFYALRYGEDWRSLAGDNLVLSMFYEIERLRDLISRTADTLNVYDDDTWAIYKALKEALEDVENSKR